MCNQFQMAQLYIEECLGNFKKRRNLNKDLPIGLTFLCPYEEVGLEQNDLTATITTVNDAVATMMSCRLRNRDCEVDLIADTGSLCYMERGNGGECRTCVKVEWGTLVSDGVLRHIYTEYDKQINSRSPNPETQCIDKMLRGKVMEETIQSIMVQLASQGMIFPGDDILQPLTSEALESNTAANMKKHAYGRQIIHHTLTCLGLNDTPQDPVWFQHICNVVSTRFAQLCGAGLAAVIDWMLMDCHASESIRVGVNGQLYKTGLNFSQFQKTVVDMSPSCPVTFQPLSHSPEIGTALVTAVLSKINTIETFLKPLQLSEEVLQEVQAKMHQEMERGLQKETRESSFLKMLPTYICNKPAGNETGQFIVLELGGKDMHIVYVRIGDKREEERLPIRKTYNLPQHLMHGTGEELFDHIASCLLDFQKVHNLGGNKMYLSFVFPFACKQTALNEGSLIKWTKGFAASDCEKKNVVELLERAIKQKTELNMSVIALVNDTTSTMMAGCYEDEKCDIGLIVGTGTNSCYMEEKKNIPMEMENMSGQMCVNMEWGAFGDNGCLDNIITNFDLDVDNSSVNPKKQRFEKMIGGMYLGEIVRHVLNGLTRNGLLLKNSTLEKNLLELDHLCSIEREEHSLDLCSALMSRGLKCNEDEAKKVKKVCRTVSRRAAQLCAAGVAAVVEKIRENRDLDHLDIAVAVNGSLYENHPHFKDDMMSTLKTLAPCCKVAFLKSDSKGKGAALISAAAITAQKQIISLNDLSCQQLMYAI